MCVQQTFTVQNKPAAVAPAKLHHPSFLRFWNWAEETVDAAKICGGAEKWVVKTETQQTFKWIARFYYFRVFYICWKRVCAVLANIRMSCPSIWATLSALLINILWFLPVVFV